MKILNALSLALFISIVLLSLPARAQSPVAAPDIRPIESLWLASPPVFPSTSERDAAYTKGLKQWRQVFDAYILIKLPPTFSDAKEFNKKANALIKEVGGEFVLVTLPVGNEGWESSANQRFAEKHHWSYDAGKSMSQTQWLTTMKELDSGTWEWVLEGAAQMPTPEQAARLASEFVKYAKSQHKKAVIWLSGEGFGIPRFAAMIKAICEATRADADYFGWMDLQSASLRSGESNWRESLGGLLDQILTLTPKEKTVIQWEHNPKWPAKDVAGTKAYIGVCQAKGINRFSALSGAEFINRAPWNEFYHTLPRAAR